MPGRMPPTSQLDWLISTTAMIVLFWFRATRDLLKSFGWGIAALHRLVCSDEVAILAARPIASLRWREADANHRSREGGHRRLGRLICCTRYRGPQENSGHIGSFEKGEFERNSA